MLAIRNSESRLLLVACTDSHQIVGATEVQLDIYLCPLKAIQEFTNQSQRVAVLNGYFIQGPVIIEGVELSTLFLTKILGADRGDVDGQINPCLRFLSRKARKATSSGSDIGQIYATGKGAPGTKFIAQS